MAHPQQPFSADTLPVAVTTLTSSAMTGDLGVLLSQTDRTSSIVLICPVPTDPSAAIDLAVKDGNYVWAARALVRSLAVPRILAGAGDDVVQLVVSHPEFGESEPLLLAAAALACSWLDIAESALARASAELARVAEPPVVDVLSVAMITMAMARDQTAIGLKQASYAREVMINLTAVERAQAAELQPVIDYHIAGFELSSGDPWHRAVDIGAGGRSLPTVARR